MPLILFSASIEIPPGAAPFINAKITNYCIEEFIPEMILEKYRAAKMAKAKILAMPTRDAKVLAKRLNKEVYNTRDICYLSEEKHDEPQVVALNRSDLPEIANQLGISKYYYQEGKRRNETSKIYKVNASQIREVWDQVIYKQEYLFYKSQMDLLQEIQSYKDVDSEVIDSEALSLLNIKNFLTAKNRPTYLTGCKIFVNKEKYTLKRLLKPGAVGEVWLAENLNGTEVAVKLLLPWHYQKDGIVSGLFSSGAKLQKKIRHPNIVKVIDGPYDDEAAEVKFVVMKYIEGKNLEEFVLGGPYEEIVQSDLEEKESEDYVKTRKKIGDSYFQQIKKIISDIAEALHVCHEEYEIAHRDICPNNILVGKNGDAYLIDFDNSALGFNDHGTKIVFLSGTEPYIAPYVKSEIPKNLSRKQKKEIAQQSDIWSLTLTLSFCLIREPLREKIKKQGLKNFYIKELDSYIYVKNFINTGLGINKKTFSSAAEFLQELHGIRYLRSPIWLGFLFTRRFYIIVSVMAIVGAVVTIGWQYNKLERAMIQQSEWLLLDHELLKRKKISNQSLEKIPIIAMFEDENNNFNATVDKLISLLSKVKIAEVTKQYKGLLIDNEFFKLNKKNMRTLKFKKPHKYAPNYAMWSLAQGTKINPKLPPEKLFSPISQFLITNAPKTGNKLHDHLTLLLKISQEVKDSYYLPILIFVGYKSKVKERSNSSVYMFRYPAYDLNNVKDYKDYNPTLRPWWKDAVSDKKREKTIIFREKNNKKWGLSSPYSGIKQNISPPRTFFCYLNDEDCEIVLGIDFIYSPPFISKK